MSDRLKGIPIGEDNFKAIIQGYGYFVKFSEQNGVKEALKQISVIVSKL